MNNNFLMESGVVASSIIAIVLLASLITFAIFSGKLGGDRKKKDQSVETINANLIKTLKCFSGLRDVELMGKTTLSFGGETFEFDAILLSYFGTIAVKNCYAQGEIYADSKEDNWVSINKDGKKSYFANPSSSTNGSVKFFKELYNAEKVKFGTSEAFIVFPARNVELYAGKSIDVYTLSSLEAKLTSDKYQQDKGADIAAMKAALEKYTVK